MDTSNTPDAESLRDNKREMFDAMRAYHQSEISHANHAVTMLVAIAGAAGAVVLAMLFPEEPPRHISEIAWGLWFAVSALAFTVGMTTHLKISADHKVYENFGVEYVKTSQLLGFYHKVEIDGKEVSLKISKTIGQGKGYRRTQWIIWSFVALLIVLTLLFAVLSERLMPAGEAGVQAGVISAPPVDSLRLFFRASARGARSAA